MDAVVKKKIINFSADVLSALALCTAFFCLVAKFKNIATFKMDGINILAARSVFSRGNRNVIDIAKNNIWCSAEKDYIKEYEGNTNKVNQNEKSEPATGSNATVEIPPKEKNPLPHSSDEPTYKIIESQFGSGGNKFENFYVKNTTGQNLDIAAEINKPADINITKTNQPQVLIFHTHTSESYMNCDEGFFYESFYPRSLDNSKNVTAVGKAITNKLISAGINTVHDVTYHDNPTYNGSYSRAAKTISANLEKYPSLQVIIDIHRDSLGSKETGKIKPTFIHNGKKAAQLMIISGCDPDGSLGFPNWIKNLRLALKLQKYCETLFPGITRPLNFSKVKYNEHITSGSLLIEIGSDVNTLEEAISTGSMLGESLANLLNDLKK